jgi:hypothetical protein
MLTGEHILALLMEPSAATYGEVLRCVVEHEDFNYHSSELLPLGQQVVAGDLAGVQDRLRALVPLWVHSPDYHVLAFAVAKRLGDAKTMELESRFWQSCLRGMLASGDGSLERPYQVARIADEYTLIRSLKKEWTRQQMLDRDGRIVDAFDCTDGATLHFLLPKVDLETGRRA